jgi:hypothetical protein
MPRDAIALADVREPTVELLCEPCGRRGRYKVERLIAAHGADMRLPGAPSRKTGFPAPRVSTRSAQPWRCSLPRCF